VQTPIFDHAPWNDSWNERVILSYHDGTARAARGHLEQLPSGSYRVHVYSAIDPLTGRELRHRQTVKPNWPWVALLIRGGFAQGLFGRRSSRL
jgi:hypothetical protein